MPYITAKSLPRRTVLRGIGATLSLPFLESMVPAFGVRGSAAGKAPHRFQTFYVPNGMAMEYWAPKVEGTAFELSPILQPLAEYRNQMLVLTGLKANWNYIHAGASGSFLTGTSRGGRNEVEILADVSMDQLLARHFASETQVASLELAMDGPANAGACTGILSCAYTHTISWRSATQPLPMEHNPRAVFERLFGGFDGDPDPRIQERINLNRRSVLDAVTRQAQLLTQSLGASDRRKIDEYQTSLREIERRIQRVETESREVRTDVLKPTGIPAGIWTIERRLSWPDSAFDSTGTPNTGSGVMAAVMPGR